MFARPDIPPPYPPTPCWSRSTSCDRELFSLRQQQGAGALFCSPPVSPQCLSFWQPLPLPAQQHLTPLPFSRCGTEAGSGSSFIKISHRHSAVDSKMVFQAWSVTKKAWRALELPWQPPTQKGKEDNQSKLAAWGRGGGSSFGAWRQTGMCSAYRIAWRSRQVDVFEIRSERRVGRDLGHAAAVIQAFPGMLESGLTPGPPVTIAPTPNPISYTCAVDVIHHINSFSQHRTWNERDPVRGMRSPPFQEVQRFVEPTSSIALGFFCFFSPSCFFCLHNGI